MLDINEYIEANPNIMLGKPVIKGTRLTVELILRKLAGGYTAKEIMEMYPGLKTKDIMAALTYATLVIENEEVIKVP